ncbi:MAG: CBS domain-containing protein [Betaproteobacteria bacterium]|nr:CBS domain-containing protein [Betaproteobacteria bacterium]
MASVPGTASSSATGLVAATTAQLRRHAPFDAMQDAHVAFLAERLKLAYFPEGEVILAGGAGIPEVCNVIKQGAVIVVSGSGSEEVELALQVGECFPVGALLANRPATRTYRASSDTFCYQLSRKDFHELVGMSDVFRDFCTHRIAHLLHHALGNLQKDVIATSEERQPLERPLREAIRREAVTLDEGEPIRTALELMVHEKIGSVILTRGAEKSLSGIVTLRDVAGRVALPRTDIDRPVREVMTPDPATLEAGEFAFQAAMRMAELGIHHIVVTEAGRIAGMISERDLFRLQRIGIASLGGEIQVAKSIERLAQLAKDVRALVPSLLLQGVSAEHVTQILSTLNDRLTRRVIALEAREAGIEPREFCWLALGSEGRHEQTLASDQDNGLVFRDPEDGDGEAQRARFLPFAAQVNEALAKVGFPLCRGGIMAGNPQWCLSEGEWRARFSRWIATGDPQAILNAIIFFDFRPLDGEASLADRLRGWLSEAIRDQQIFLRALAQNALTNRPPLGVVRDFTLSDDADHPGTIDLKVNGATLFIDAARVMALAEGVPFTGTAPRIREAAVRRGLTKEEAEGWVSAFHYLQLFRLRHQTSQVQKGEVPTNYVDPDRLNDLDRRLLKEALRTARGMQRRLALDYHL